MVGEVKVVFSVGGKQFEETTLASNHQKMTEFLARIMEELALNNSPADWHEFARQLVAYYAGAPV